MDAGDILAQKELAILPDETARELKPRLIALGSELLLATLPTFERGGLIPIRQDDARATRARKFTKEDGHIALSDSGEQNWHKYRAFAEWPGTYLFDENGKRIKITKAKFKNGEFVIEKIIPEGGREIPYEEAQATP
jgi:methionyl-tRNA formyltransferase